MKCPKCGGTGEMQICEMGFIGKDECDKCHGKGYLNNEEWFDGLNTEEKAKWLENKMTWAAQEQGTFTAKGWEKWLKEKHNGSV